MYIRPFSEITRHDATLAGGKGASLGEMTSAFAKDSENTSLQKENNQVFHGRVERGEGLGKKFGVPTANIPYREDLSPGTYAGQAEVDGVRYEAAIYVDARRNLIESHLLGYSGDLYGKEMSVTLFQKLAEPESISNREELERFIKAQVSAVREYFLKRNGTHDTK